jgi:hypothetical protein
MNIETSIIVLTHMFCVAIGFLLAWLIFANNNKTVAIYNNDSQEKHKVSELSNNTKEKIKKIEIDSRTIVVNDINNDFTKMFDSLGSNSINKDNIMEAVDKLSQLKNNGGSNG